MQQTVDAARHTLFVAEHPQETMAMLTPLAPQRERLDIPEQRALMELLGLAYEKEQHYDEATESFLSIGDFYQSGYCQMLGGHLDRAAQLWRNLLTMRPNHWCLTLYGLVSGNLHSMPTFLQVRNHLEADIVHLSRAGQAGMLANVLRSLDALADVNYEVYKFAGRALFHSGDLTQAGPLLLQGQKVLPNDPEVYYHLGQYYHAIGKDEDAGLVLHQCILISPSYTPALDLHQTVHANKACFMPLG